jgi:chemotaxis protein methyltransferase CheR
METLEYNYVRREILRLTGIDLHGYKSPQMQRRLGAYLVRSGSPTWAHLFRAIREDEQAIRRLKDYLTINVSAFFRDQERYQYLQRVILPELLERRSGLRIWSAGCSRGQEPYSLALLLADQPGLMSRHRILATDVDATALEWAQAGGPYPAEDLVNVPRSLQLRYFTEERGGYRVVEPLRRQVTFRQHNLLTTPVEQSFDLIVCRNVVIYFTPDAKHELYCRFYQALRPGGVLFVGATEVIARATERGFESKGISFYQRPAGGA